MSEMIAAAGGRPLPPQEARQLAPLQLAYLGDAVYDLYARTGIARSPGTAHAWHLRSVKLVCAAAQSRALALVEPQLSPDEAAVVRRGRNAQMKPPKNADPADYARATALEALVGYLYISGQSERLLQLMALALPGNCAEPPAAAAP